MRKFVLTSATSDKVMQEFEGEWLELNGDCVLVMANDGMGTSRAFAVIRLHPGQVMKELKK